jgi:hypothetical protein
VILKSKRPLLLFGLIVTVLACATISLRAQVDNKKRDDQEAAKRKELEKNSLRLLDEAIGGVASIKLRENRSYILATAADLLWPHDEKRARTLFWEALASLKLPMEIEANATNAKNPNPLASPGAAGSKTFMEHDAARSKRHYLLNRVALRDPQLALDMLRSTRQSGPSRDPGKRYDLDVLLEQRLMYAAAANDPARVLQLAHETLARELDFRFLDSVEEVNRRNPDAGTQLCGEIIAKLKTENLASNWIAAFFAQRLLEYSRPKGLIIIDMGYQPPRVVSVKIDDQQRRELAVMLTNAALNAPGGSDVLKNIQFVMRDIEKYAPDRVANVRVRVAAYNNTLRPDQRDRNNFRLRFERATAEEMIKAAPTVAEAQRRGLFYQAATKAVVRGETDRFRELLNSQIKDESERKRALDDLDNQQLDYDIENGKSDDLEKLIPLLRAKSQREIAMSRLAILLDKKDQHDKAVKLLDEARTSANERQPAWPLTIMLGYALVDPSKAFAVIEPIIDHHNEEMSKPVRLEQMVTAGTMKDGEVILHPTENPLDYTMAKYSEGVVSLAKTDFDRTKALAERFQRNELKIITRLLMAQMLLRHLEQASKQ